MTSRCAAFIALLATACGGPGDSPAPRYVEALASAEVPASLSQSLVLLKGGIACVTETYWHRIVCADPGGESLAFGAEGEGPGEFLFPEVVLRAPEGMIGVLDTDLQRLSLFTETGDFVKVTAGLPIGFRGLERKAVGETLVGSYRDLSRNRSLFFAEIELATGHVLRERTFPLEEDVLDCSTPSAADRRLSAGYSGSGRSLLFVACHGEFLVWYADRNDAEPAAIVRSTYVERYPSDRDVASVLRTLQAEPWLATSEEEVRATPKVWYGPRLVDDRGRFWAVSHWEYVEEVIPGTSYIDMFDLTSEGPRYALTLEVKDKAIGMDVLNDTLAVLVERDVGDVMPERRVDWYDVSTVTVGDRQTPN